MTRRRFALDHNFPSPLVAALVDVLPMAELVAVREIDARWAELDDWELLRALHEHDGGWDGLVTNDEAMLSLPKEMTVLDQTRLTLVVARGEGHNPVRAVGTLLCHLSHICHQTTPEAAQIWRLSVAQKKPESAYDYLERIAARSKTTVAKLVAEHKIREIGRTRS